MRHVIDLCQEGLYRPDIATLDCGSLNFGDGNRAYVSTPNYLRQGAGICKDLGVKPELEVFDTGNLWFVRQMVKEGCSPPVTDPIVHGHSLRCSRRRGASAGDGQHSAENCNWGTFAISRMQMPWVAQAVLLGAMCASTGGQSLFEQGVYASNAQLVEKARTIIEAMGARVLTAAQAREKLQLR